MRLLAMVLAALLLLSNQPAWAWMNNPPGDKYWPPIPDNAGLNFFLGTWEPQCNNGTWVSDVDEAHGPMTLHSDGKISYRMRKPYMPTRYRLIEETPYYVVLMVRKVSKERGEILRFWLLQRLEAWTGSIGVNSCWPEKEDLKGFDWSKSDDEALRRVWRGSKTCNPEINYKSVPTSFLGDHWDQECHFRRPD